MGVYQRRRCRMKARASSTALVPFEDAASPTHLAAILEAKSFSRCLQTQMTREGDSEGLLKLLARQADTQPLLVWQSASSFRGG